MNNKYKQPDEKATDKQFKVLAGAIIAMIGLLTIMSLLPYV